MKDLLQNNKHRPWPIPKKRWKFYQEWNKAVFLHWKVDFDALRKLVPAGLEIDLFEGNAWVSLVAFTMEKIRPRNLPYFSPVSDFDEINIRTYIKSGNKTGVYFLSIEGGKRLSCALAKSISGLPYRFSKMHREKGAFFSENTPHKESFSIRFSVEELQNKNNFDYWVTERYALFQETSKGINEFEIHHLEWPIQKLKTTALEVKYDRFKNLIGRPPDKAHYSSGVKVLAFNKKEMKTGGF